MTTITIPGKGKKQKDLVAIPRDEYEEFSRWKKSGKIKEFTPTAAEKKDLMEARKEYAKGDYITLEQLKHELEASSKRKG